MMCEGVMLYLMLVVVFSELSKKWWFFVILGWGEYVLVLYTFTCIDPVNLWKLDIHWQDILQLVQEETKKQV